MIYFLQHHYLLIFILLIIFFAISVLELFAFLHWRKKSKYETQMLMFRDKALIRQIDAHFIFNFLNSLQSSLIADKKMEAIKNLGKFSNVLRRFLENSLQTQNPIEREIDALGKYLEIEQIRFKNAFDFEINIDPEINPYLFTIPSFLLQPFVENSLYHGIMLLDESDNRKGKILIELKKLENFILIVVDDNGVGRKRAAVMEQKREKKSLGNAFIEKRLETLSKIYSKLFSVKFIDKEDKISGKSMGTRVEIMVPQILNK
jgi:LytS/YehU family sensor histidine kinase